jgi:3-phosphoshikimate 1-carboxyvinyltransferase
MIRISAPTNTINASIKLSGSKSISNRFLIINELLKSNLEFHNLSDSEDTLLLKRALIQVKEKKNALIDVHHAGSDFRFLTAFLSVTEGQWIVSGSERLRNRPIAPLVQALKQLGADISYKEKEGFAPLTIKGKKLKGGTIELDSSISSQFVTALLLIAPVLENGLTIHLTGNIVSRPYIIMTVELLKKFGVRVNESSDLISVPPSSIFHFPSSIHIESDWSSASYWYSICALKKNSRIKLSFLAKNSLQADSVLPDLFEKLGVKSSFDNESVTISSTGSSIKEFHYDFTNCPDIAQTLAVTCLGLGIKATLFGLSTLKVKETDRIFALKNELERFGTKVTISENELQIDPISLNTNFVRISTYNDHRMAMSFAPLALLTKSIEIDDPSVVEKSYPRFWEDLKSAGFSINLQP